MAPPSKLEAKLKKAQAKIKKLEERKDQELEALKRVPGVRNAIFGMTFAGLTFAYKEGLIDMFPAFFFQFGEGPKKDAILELLKAELGILGLLVPGAGGGVIKAPKDADALFQDDIKKFEKKRQEAQDELAGIPPGVQFEIQRTLLGGSLTRIEKELAIIRQQWRVYTIKAYLVAMGFAGATMLFLMETSTSEVMDIGAKALDAVTPLT